ncbi:MAG TPA: glycosyltransferase [Acidimicrobiales bacterium]|nr:glycosyltransferase [Acidimicrobiales bacterium]
MTARVLHQFVPNFAAGDAIGAHVRHTQRVLRDAGFVSDIFYDEAQASVRKLGRPRSSFDVAGDGADGRAWVLFQLSTGSEMTRFVLDLGLPYGVYFHNITPPAYFERWEPNAAENLRRALQDMRRLAPQARFAMANSEFSRVELADAGFDPTATVPVLVDWSEYDTRPNAKVLARLQREKAVGGGARWIFVGRIAPNKCQHDVIAAFAAYRDLYDGDARLTLVGGRTANVYYRSLEVLAEELGVSEAVELTDTIPFDEILAHWRAADVYVTLSEHEGFGVPALEAMTFGVPVVAYASSAIPETVADAGVLLETKDPVVVATAVHRVLSDDSLRNELIAAGHARRSQYDLDVVAARMLETVEAGMSGG